MSNLKSSAHPTYWSSLLSKCLILISKQENVLGGFFSTPALGSDLTCLGKPQVYFRTLRLHTRRTWHWSSVQDLENCRNIAISTWKTFSTEHPWVWVFASYFPSCMVEKLPLPWVPPWWQPRPGRTWSIAPWLKSCCWLLSVSHSVVSDSLQLHRL